MIISRRTVATLETSSSVDLERHRSSQFPANYLALCMDWIDTAMLTLSYPPRRSFQVFPPPFYRSSGAV